MTDPDISDWIERKNKMRAQKSKDRLPELRQMAQAAAAVGLLTGDPAWDYLIQTLQHEQEIDQKMLDNVIPTMIGARPTHEALATIQLEAVRLAERISIRERLMGLPKEIKDQGLKAIDAVREVERSQ